MSPQTAPTTLESTYPARARRSLRWRRFVAAAVLVYAASIFALWLWMYLEGDRSWLATMFLFGPRFLCALPLPVLALAALVWQRRLLWIVAVTTVMILGPILGFHAHFPGTGPGELRVLTCNVAQRAYSDVELADLIDRERPDIVALQEVVVPPPEIVWPRGWHVVHRDELLVASRYPVAMEDAMFRPSVPGKLVVIRYKISAPGRDVQLFNLHLMTPRWGFEAVLDREKGLDLSEVPRVDAMLWLRAAEQEEVSQWINTFEDPKIIVGDFNTPVESTIFRRCWSGYKNSFSAAGFGLGFTKITAKRGWSYGARIDHVLYTAPWRCLRAAVGPDIGSDHRPLIAVFE